MLARSCQWSFCSRVATPTTFICDQTQCLCYIEEMTEQRDKETERPRDRGSKLRRRVLTIKHHVYVRFLLHIVILLERGDSDDVCKR
jgi:hypothetical protein